MEDAFVLDDHSSTIDTAFIISSSFYHCYLHCHHQVSRVCLDFFKIFHHWMLTSQLLPCQYILQHFQSVCCMTMQYEVYSMQYAKRVASKMQLAYIRLYANLCKLIYMQYAVCAILQFQSGFHQIETRLKSPISLITVWKFGPFSRKLPSEGRWYALPCLNLGVTARGHSICSSAKYQPQHQRRHQHQFI